MILCQRRGRKSEQFVGDSRVGRAVGLWGERPSAVLCGSDRDVLNALSLPEFLGLLYLGLTGLFLLGLRLIRELSSWGD